MYILTFVDLVNMGYNVKAVYKFDNKEDASNFMKEQYIHHCLEEHITNPLDNDSFDYEYSNSYAYIFGKYYWDIFEV